MIAICVVFAAVMLVIGVFAAAGISSGADGDGNRPDAAQTESDRTSQTEPDDPASEEKTDPPGAASDGSSAPADTEKEGDPGESGKDDDTKAPDGSETDANGGESTSEGAGREVMTTEAPEPEPEPKYTVEFRFWDRDAIVAKTDGGTVRQILADNGYTLDSFHVPTIGADDYVDYDAVVEVLTLSYETVNLTEEIPFSTDYVYSDSYPSGQTFETTSGAVGYKQTMYTIEYINGQENYRSLDSEYVTQYPVNQVITVGTAPAYVVDGAGVLYAADGTAYSYSKAITVTTTYYNLPGNTASGLPVGDGIVATDPSVIPLGTSIYLKCDSLDLGVRYAADTGVYGNWVDVWMNESSPYFSIFAPVGVWQMTCYILN